MGTRFNPPPGWEPGEGIMPDFWVPDPAWPDAPEGWHFYLDDDGNPVDPPQRAWLPPDVKAATVAAEDADFRRRKHRGWRPFWIVVGVIAALLVGFLYVPNVGKLPGLTAPLVLEHGEKFAGLKLAPGFTTVAGEQREQPPADFAGGKECGPWWADFRESSSMSTRRLADYRGTLNLYTRDSRQRNERIFDSEFPCRNEMRRLWNGPPLQVEDGHEGPARFQKFTSDDDPKFQFTIVRVAYRNAVVEVQTGKGAPTVEPRQFARDVVKELDAWRVWGPWEGSQK